MSKKQLFIFLLIIMLPLLMLGWVGALLLQQDRIAEEVRLNELNTTQLASIEQQLQDQFKNYATEFSALAQLLELDAENLRYLARQHARIRQVVLLGPNGERQHPPVNAALSQDEQRLLSRAGGLFDGGLLAATQTITENAVRNKPVAIVEMINYQNVSVVDLGYELDAGLEEELRGIVSGTSGAMSSYADASVGSNFRNEATDKKQSERQELGLNNKDVAKLSQDRAVSESRIEANQAAINRAEVNSAPPYRAQREALNLPALNSTAENSALTQTNSRAARSQSDANLEQQRNQVFGQARRDRQATEAIQTEQATSSVQPSASVSSNSAVAKQRNRPVNKNVLTNNAGWYSWHHGRTLRHAYWQRLPNGSVLAFELESARVKADLIAKLPDTTTNGMRDGIRLMDAHGVPIYQWGNWFVGRRLALNNAPNGFNGRADQVSAPGGSNGPNSTGYSGGNVFDVNIKGSSNATSGQDPIAALSRSLASPLATWRLEYFRGTESVSNSQRLLLAAIILFGLLLIALLAWYFLREQNREARLASQRVSFVNQVSHELKTPLTNVRMYAEMASSAVEQDYAIEFDDSRPADDSTPAISNYLNIIVAESQRLSRLIGNVLSFARSERGQLSFRPRAMVPDDVISDVIEHFTPSFRDHQIVVKAELAADKIVLFDPDILEQVLNNLFSNIEKYAAVGKRVELTSQIIDKDLLVTVRDFGPGINKSNANRVFDPFYRVGDQVSEGVSGTGIGLSIARELVELHGGSILLTQATPGCLFTIRLVCDKA